MFPAPLFPAGPFPPPAFPGKGKGPGQSAPPYRPPSPTGWKTTAVRNGPDPYATRASRTGSGAGGH